MRPMARSLNGLGAGPQCEMTGGAEPLIWDEDGDSRGGWTMAGEGGGFILQIPSLTIARHVWGGNMGGPVSVSGVSGSCCEESG